MIKTIALGFFVLTSLTLGGLLVQEKQRTAAQSSRVAELQTQVASQHDEIQKTATAAAALEQKHSQLLARAKAAKQALLEARNAAMPGPAAVPVADASADANPTGKPKTPANPFSGSLAKMMKDPAMKNMMRATQATTIRQMYGDLVKQWALSPEETNTFYDLLLDKQMDQMDQGMAYLEKGPDAAKTAAAVATDPDAKLKASLGDDLYKQYQDYQKTLGSRLAVNQYQQQLAVSNAPAMTADQSKSLLQAITEEQANMPSGSFFRPAAPGANPLGTDPAQMDQYIKGQGELNDKVDARMANTLSAEQLQVLKEQQQQMLATQRTVMEMTAKMMAPSPTP